MREIRSPLDGIPSPFAARAALDAYLVGAYKPKVVADFAGIYSANEYYRTGGAASTFSDMFSYTGASNKTMTDSDGKLKWAPHNLVLRSEEFDLSPWGLATQGTGVLPTITPDYALAPDGVSLATRLQCSRASAGGGDRSRLEQILPSTNYAPIGAQLTRGIWVKSTDGSNQDIQITDSSEANSINTVTVGSDWVFVTITYPVLLSNSGNFWVGFVSANTSALTTDVLIWGAHLYRSDLGGMVNNPDRNDSYVPTTSSAVYLPRRNHYGWNGSTWVNKGLLLETEERTNVALNSNDFTSVWIGNRASAALTSTGLDGETSAFTLTDTSTGGSSTSTIRQAVTVVTSTAYTFSIYAKASTLSWIKLAGQGFTTPSDGGVWFDLINGAKGTEETGFSGSIEDVGNGWYRCAITFTTDAANTAGIIYVYICDSDNDTFVDQDGTSSIIISGAQFEKGSTPSSYMPTTGSTFIRAAETLTIPAAKMAWPTPNVIGPELVTNGTFDTDTDWTKSAGWTISGGAASHDGTGGGSQIDQPNVLTSGGVYLVTFDLVLTSGAGIAFRPTKSSAVGQVSFSTSGSKSLYFVSGDGNVTFAALASFVGTIDNVSVREIDPLSVSLQMQGEMTYADTNVGGELTWYNWAADVNNRLLVYMATSAGTGQLNAFQAASGASDSISSTGSYYSPDILVPYNIASRHGSTFLNGAVDGTALTANTTPTALPDLSATNFSLGYDYMGTIALFRQDNNDWADAGIVTATSKPVNIFVPVISGGIFVGSILTTTDGTWADSPTFTYQWLRDGVAIAGATASTYTLVSADLGANISCRVTATLNGLSTDATSAAVGPISQVSSLFASGEDGAWYDPSDTTSLYQSRTGGDYADADGDVVGIMLDKSQMGGSTAAAFIAGQTELVTNGTFDTDTTGWAETRASGSLSAVGGRLRMTTTAGVTCAVSQQITGLTVGRWYAFDIDAYIGTSGGIMFMRDHVNADLNTGDNLTASANDFTYSAIFKADATTVYVGLVATFTGAGEYIEIDNVSVKEIPGNHAVAPSAAARPLYKTAGGLHWIEADGVDDVFDIPAIQLGTAALFSLGLKQTGTSGIGWMPIGGGDTNLGTDYRSYIWSYGIENRISLRLAGAAAGLEATLAAAPLEDLLDHVLTWNRTSGTDMAIDLDGAEIASTTTSDTGNFPVRQILATYTNTYYEPGRLYGAVIRNAATSEDEQGNVEAYLASKSGVTL